MIISERAPPSLFKGFLLYPINFPLTSLLYIILNLKNVNDLIISGHTNSNNLEYRSDINAGRLTRCFVVVFNGDFPGLLQGLDYKICMVATTSYWSLDAQN